MKKLLLTILVCLVIVNNCHAAPFGYSRFAGNTSGGGSTSPTSPGGTVTGANQYRTAGGAFGGDDSLIDNGAGLLTAVGVSSTNISVTNLVLTSSTLLAGQNLYARLNGSAFVVDGSGGFQYNAATDRSIFAETDLPANTTPSATVHVSGTLAVISNTVLGGITPSTAILSAYGNVSASIFFGNDVVDTAILPAFSWIGDTNTGMFNSAADAIGFTTGGTERFRTMGGGTPRAAMTTNFIIGGAITDFPSSTLHVSGTMRVTSLSTAAGTGAVCWDSSTGIFSTGVCTISDQSLKRNIQSYNDGLAVIMSLKPVTFYFKDSKYGDNQEIGLIAQDVAEIEPRLVTDAGFYGATTDASGTVINPGTHISGVDYAKVVIPLIAAVQELTARVQVLEAAQMLSK